MSKKQQHKDKGPQLELLQFAQGGNLPCTCDPECLSVQAYLRFINLSKIKTTNLDQIGMIRAAIQAPRFPILISNDMNKDTKKYEKREFSGDIAIIAALKTKQSLNLDQIATPEQEAKLLAFQVLLHEKLLPCIVRCTFFYCTFFCSPTLLTTCCYHCCTIALLLVEEQGKL